MDISPLIKRYEDRIQTGSYFSLSMFCDFSYLFPLSLLVLREISDNTEAHLDSIDALSGCIARINEATDLSAFYSSAISMLVTPFYFSELIILDRKQEISNSSRMGLCNHASSDIRASMGDVVWIVKDRVEPEVLYEAAKKNVTRPLAYNYGYLALLAYLTARRPEVSGEAGLLLRSAEVAECCLVKDGAAGIDPDTLMAGYDEYLGSYLDGFLEKQCAGRESPRASA